MECTQLNPVRLDDDPNSWEKAREIMNCKTYLNNYSPESEDVLLHAKMISRKVAVSGWVRAAQTGMVVAYYGRPTFNSGRQ
ncbi:hypothetical protein B5X24_HaOG205661 [Helicoverpa armigera]|uniref:Uncharacterized protein n=1 Tax=Helicoverpa armigera TaxID=29058 RepID=A0A2W1BQE9_HELAM|nr:hypothetical protein B5X24_HaOG205661 [Helicoverpa armigera]